MILDQFYGPDDRMSRIELGTPEMDVLVGVCPSGQIEHMHIRGKSVSACTSIAMQTEWIGSATSRHVARDSHQRLSGALDVQCVWNVSIRRIQRRSRKNRRCQRRRQGTICTFYFIVLYFLDTGLALRWVWDIKSHPGHWGGSQWRTHRADAPQYGGLFLFLKIRTGDLCALRCKLRSKVYPVLLPKGSFTRLE